MTDKTDGKTADKAPPRSIKTRVVWPEKRCPDCKSPNVYAGGPTRHEGERYYECKACGMTFIGCTQ